MAQVFVRYSPHTWLLELNIFLKLFFEQNKPTRFKYLAFTFFFFVEKGFWERY